MNEVRVRLNDAEAAELRTLAEEEASSMSAVVRQAVHARRQMRDAPTRVTAIDTPPTRKA